MQCMHDDANLVELNSFCSKKKHGEILVGILDKRASFMFKFAAFCFSDVNKGREIAYQFNKQTREKILPFISFVFKEAN